MNSRRPCILIVDDYGPILTGICEILEASGYTALPAHSGQGALELMGRVHPDLIIADIMMPSMSGFELHNTIQARPEWQTVPFIFLTGMADMESIERARELGVDTYLTKPISGEDLLAPVRKQLDRGEAEQHRRPSAKCRDAEARGDGEAIPN